MQGPDLGGLFVGLLVLGVAFTLVEWRCRSVPGAPWYRRADVRTDLAYWFFTPLATRAATRFCVGIAVFGLVVAAGGSAAQLREDIARGTFPVLGPPALAAWLRGLPFWAQLVLGLLLADGIAYAMHRAFHRRPLWGLHAVHHSSPHLDWLSSVRLHPLNDLGMRVVQTLPLLLLGFEPRVFAVVAPFFGLYAIALHANVGWSFGPLRYVIATPRFHRWHHTSAREGRDRNFAGLFPLWDLLFGTFHVPERAPQAFGAGDEPVPAGLLRQLAYPFRRPAPTERLASEMGAG